MQREASVDVTYTVGVTIGTTRIRCCDTGAITPAQARKLAEALVELADWAEGRL